MDLTFIAIKGALVLILFGISLLIAAYATYSERKIAAFMQDRIGPDRAGPFGLLQPLADGAKFFFKENFDPVNADRFLFILGPSLAMIVALMTSAVIPFGPPILVDGVSYSLQVTDLNIGVLYIFSVVSLGVYGIMIGGWASNNKYSLMGAIRASSQMISYEIGMGIAMVAVIMLSGSLSLSEIVTQQQGQLYGLGFMPSGLNWNIFYQPLGFLIFLTCAFAECNRTPFDLSECEQELVGGYHTEYSSMKLGMYLFSEYINMFVSGALMTCLYFGGYSFPGMETVAASVPQWLFVLLALAVIFAKIFGFIFFFMWIRWTVPRFRYDQLMNVGWKVLMPLALFNMFVTGLGILGHQGF